MQRSNSNSGIIKSETPKINLVKLILHAAHAQFFNIRKGEDFGCDRCSSFFLLFVCGHLKLIQCSVISESSVRK